MNEKRFAYGKTDLFEWVEDNGEMISTKECVNKLNELVINCHRLEKENEQLRNELQFFDNIINFFASNPMTKYSSKADLIEEMKLLEKNGWL